MLQGGNFIERSWNLCAWNDRLASHRFESCFIMRSRDWFWFQVENREKTCNPNLYVKYTPSFLCSNWFSLPSISYWVFLDLAFLKSEHSSCRTAKSTSFSKTWIYQHRSSGLDLWEFVVELVGMSRNSRDTPSSWHPQICHTTPIIEMFRLGFLSLQMY